MVGDLIAGIKKIYPERLVKGGVLNFRIAMLGILGIALLLAGGLFNTQLAEPKNSVQIETGKNSTVMYRSYEEALEAKLANLLSQVKGAGAVAVSVTLETSSMQEHAKNISKENKTIQEKDTSGGIRTTTETKESEQILLGKENGIDRPVIVRETKPVIKGVLVIAEGAGDSSVKANLTKAVEAGLGIPAYKITVLTQRR